MWKDIARGTGITAPNLAASLAEQAGDLGAAHALFALGLAFDAARPGDHVLLAGFGSGCDALIFRVDAKVPGAAGVRAALGAGEALTDSVRFMSLRCGVALRSEERPLGKECVSPWRSRRSPEHQKT